MLRLDDPRWSELLGGYRVPYDARLVLHRLTADFTDRAAWEELWGELHHQGDIGEASYAAITALAEVARTAARRDWNLYALAATVEVERHATKNPPVPPWFSQDYHRAWDVLSQLALQDLRTAKDRYVVRSTLAVIALARGELKLGALLADLDESELHEYVEEHLAWSQRYRQHGR